MNAIAAKLERYKNPWQELKLQYGANKGKAYTGAGQPASPCASACAAMQLCTSLPLRAQGLCILQSSSQSSTAQQHTAQCSIFACWPLIEFLERKSPP